MAIASATVKALARGHGFDLVGVARAEPSRQLDRFRNWIDAGHAAEMAYLTRPDAIERRRDPRTSLPSAKSVVVVGLNYAQPESAVNSLVTDVAVPAIRGKVAQYARRLDYHDVMRVRLTALADAIVEQAGEALAYRLYIDTGPLLERELAARAGLGWQGKNTCLINPRHGSYYLLGELLLNLELEPDEPFVADRCGSCTRCLDACPTDAFVAPRGLDSRRCIAYLTIEHRGALPIEFRDQLRGWIFGCDICQEVCPWNQRFAQPTTDPALLDPDPANWRLVDLLGLDDAGFQRRFPGSPIKRTKRRGLARNIATVLGAVGGAAELPALAAALGDREPLARGHAAWAIAAIARRLGQREPAESWLRAALAAESEPWVQAELEAGIVALSDISPNAEATRADPTVARPGNVPEPPTGPGV